PGLLAGPGAGGRPHRRAAGAGGRLRRDGGAAPAGPARRRPRRAGRVLRVAPAGGAAHSECEQSGVGGKMTVGTASRGGAGMTVKEALAGVAAPLPEGRLRQLLDFARFLSREQEQEDWRSFGRAQLARAYGPDEPDYTAADLRANL